VSSYTLSSSTILPSTLPSNLASMPATDLNSLSSIAASASGLEDTSPSLEDVPSRPTPPTGSGGKDELKDGDKADGDDGEKGEGDKKESWWEWLTHKADGVKDWVDEFIHDHVPQDKGDEGKKDG